MNEVFVDTWAWIALLNDRDQQSAIAQVVLAQLREQKSKLITSDFILLEVADALSASQLRERTVAFINGLRRNPMVHIVPISDLILQLAWDLYSSRQDKSWGLTERW